MHRIGHLGLPRLCATVACLVALAHSAHADEPLAEMLRRLPSSTNALAVIDIKAMNASPIAKREGWSARRQVLTDGTAFLPKNIDMIVMATTIDVSDFHNVWNLALIDLAVDASTDSIVANERGTKDQIAGREVVWTPRNAYIVPLRKRLIAQFSPANRQELGRWLKLEKESAVPKLSPFLNQASSRLGRDGQAIVAFDLDDVFLPAAVREFVKASQALPANADRDKIAKVLTSIQGLRLGASAADDVSGTLVVEFGEAVAPLGEAAKPLLLEALSALGAELEDLPNWKAVSVGTSVTLSGKLTPGAMNRILSLFDLPNQADIPEASPGAAPNEVKNSPQSVALATKRYYTSINTVLGDLKAQKATSQGGMALWYSRYAKKLDALPILNVDPELVKWGQQLTDSLRRVGLAYDGVSAATGYRQTISGSGYYWNYGGSNVSRADASRIRKQEDGYALKVYKDTWNDIDSQLASIRKTLTVKYQIEF